MLSIIIMSSLVVVGWADDANQIIKQHEDALSRLHSIRATLESRRSTDRGATWKPSSKIRIAKSGQRERFHETVYGGYFAGQWRDGIGHRDLAYGPSEWKFMSGFDPDNPPHLPLKGDESPRVNGAIYPPEPTGPHGRKVSWTRFLLLIPASNYSLRELYNASRVKTLKQSNDGSAAETPTFFLESPDGMYNYIVSLSREHNYCICKLITENKGDRTGKIAPSKFTEEVMSFYDYEWGLSLPKLIRTSNAYEQDVVSEQVTMVESINVPIPDSELLLEFPPGTRVNDGVGMKLHVWGEGKPNLSFSTAREMTDWVRAQRKAMSQDHRRGGSWPTILAFSVLSLILLVCILTRWRFLRVFNWGRT
jgi:hypothetical protein